LTRSILIAALIFIVIGLGLILYSDPVFRTGASFSGFPTGFSGSSTIFQECRTMTNETVQQCLANNGVNFSGFGSGAGPRFASGAFGSLDIGILGVALAGIGSILIMVQIFKIPKDTWRNQTK
jgi:hypothetical protein